MPTRPASAPPKVNASEVVALTIDSTRDLLRMDLPSEFSQWADSAANTIRDVAELVAREHDARLNTIATDPHYSDLGRAERSAKIRANVAAELQRLRSAKVAPMKDRAESVMMRALPTVAVRLPSDAAERDEFLAFAAALRAEVRALDALQRKIIYETATDPRVLWAFEHGAPIVEMRGSMPVLVPLVTADAIAEQRVHRLRQSAPEAAAELEAIDLVRNAIESAIGAAETAIVQAAGLSFVTADDRDLRLRELMTAGA